MRVSGGAMGTTTIGGTAGGAGAKDGAGAATRLAANLDRKSAAPDILGWVLVGCFKFLGTLSAVDPPWWVRVSHQRTCRANRGTSIASAFPLSFSHCQDTPEFQDIFRTAAQIKGAQVS